MIKIIINVDPKENILDPQGKTVHHALHNLGFAQIEDVKIGKHIVIELQTDNKEEAIKSAKDMCEKLLCNPLIETYTVEVAQ